MKPLPGVHSDDAETLPEIKIEHIAEVSKKDFFLTNFLFSD